MVILVNCKNKEDQIKNEGARVVTTDFSDAQGQLSPKSMMESCQNLNSSKLKIMVGLVFCKSKEDPPKNECTKVVTTFLPL